MEPQRGYYMGYPTVSLLTFIDHFPSDDDKLETDGNNQESPMENGEWLFFLYNLFCYYVIIFVYLIKATNGQVISVIFI